MKDLRVGVDIGGTFTDIVLLADDGDVVVKKISSSVENHAQAIVAGLTEIFTDQNVTPRQIVEIMHATTVAANAILELKGARVGLIGTKGFRDILEIRNLRMPSLYDLTWNKPPSLVERYLRRVVDERISASGEIVKELEHGDVCVQVDALLEEGVDAIAVCLINSYANPIHEQAIARVIEDRAPGLAHCISFDVLPEIKEYERTSTTVVNAYILPIVERYLGSLRESLTDNGVASPLLIMQSNGGLTPAGEAVTKPVNIVESGPAAGVVGAHAITKALAEPNIVSFDMGGTTAKASLIEAGEYTRSREYSVGGGIMMGSRLLTGAGYLLGVPAIDLAEVGAGGGSIVSLDAGGSLQVGPQSAGAEPGPVCYDIGGTEPTVTDASVVLGYLNPRFLCGGELAVNASLAHEVFEQRVATPMGLELAHAAYATRQVTISNMIRAIRAVSSERGRDPREYALFAFGGNGALFAVGMAQELNMGRIIVPPAAGLFSAFGLLYAEVEHHYSRTLRVLLRDTRPALIESVFQELEGSARSQLSTDGFDSAHISLQRNAGLHYHGQRYELELTLDGEEIDSQRLETLEEAFGREHQRTYGHRAGTEEPVELVNIRVVGRGLAKSNRVPARLNLRLKEKTGEATTRCAYFGPEAGWIDTPVLSRKEIGDGVAGPCIIEEYDSTCLIPPGADAGLDASANIIITVQGGGQ